MALTSIPEDRQKPDPYTLRPKQQIAVEKGVHWLKHGPKHKNAIIVLPTGYGKSLVAANIIRELDAPCIISQPSEEILDQNLGKIRDYGFEPSVFSASKGRKEIGQITMVTMGSVWKHPELFKDFKYWIPDECHRLNPDEGIYNSFLEKLPHLRLLGLSVSGDSIVELTGGPFGKGFVGTLAKAFSLALNKGLAMYKNGSLDVIDFEEVRARGWTGKEFGWKTCRRIIRHSGEAVPLRIITAHSNSLTLTEDHSMYMATRGENVRVTRGATRTTKYRPKIHCPVSMEVRPGDIAIGDDGANWEDVNTEQIYNMVEFAARFMTPFRVRVKCDTKTLSEELLLPYATGKRPKAMARRWLKTGSLPIAVYRALGDLAPTCLYLSTEGKGGTISPTVKLSDWAYMLGFYIGDGWLCSGAGGRLGFAVERAMEAKVQQALSHLEGVGWRPTAKPETDKGSVEIRGSNMFLYYLIMHVCGRRECFDKRIPGEWITSWTKERRAELLEGLSDSDGHAQAPNPRNRTGNAFTTTGYDLADDVLALLRSLGVTGGKHLRKPSAERRGGQIDGRQIIGRRDSYSVIWSGNAGAGNNQGHRGARKHFVHDKQCFAEMRVKKNEEIVCEPYVYDLEMEGHPSFVASGFLVHNTATPIRLATNSKGAILRWLPRMVPRIFNETIYWVQLAEAFRDGHLAKLEYWQIPGVDKSKVKLNTTGAEFDDRSAQRHLLEIRFVDKIVKVVLRAIARGRKSILVFTQSVDDSRYVVEQLRAAGITAEVVCSDEKITSKAARRKIGEQFKAGNVQVVANVGCWTTGFDHPALDTVVLARLTKSLMLAMQMMGRVVRRHESKETGWVVDMVGIIEQFGRLEDLTIRTEGGRKFYFASGTRQLSNVYFGEASAKSKFFANRFKQNKTFDRGTGRFV